ncbi:hypothetical protein BDZ89DRAFT_1072704 [Hymenopellis radicata]|nr:hypothetical protein BDZ89DRAFT_1072704 [Hymenopellis radicata]
MCRRTAFVRDSFATCGARLFRDLSMAQTHVDSANARVIPTSIKVTIPGREGRIQRDPLPRLRSSLPRTARIISAWSSQSLSQPFCLPIRLHTVPYPSTCTPTAKTA